MQVLFFVLFFMDLRGFYQYCEFLNEVIRPFYKIRTCHRSNLPVIARGRMRTFYDCSVFARERGGLAINFSPPGESFTISNYLQDNYFYNCLVLGCSELEYSESLINDSSFDYYSIYGNSEGLLNATCISSVGLFEVFHERENYTTAISMCHEIGGDLAHIASEQRTHGISSMVNSHLKDWFKIAYVGLADLQNTGGFQTPMGDSLTCYKYRAWSPGHPRRKHQYENCVVIDSDTCWRIINCNEKLPFVCELYPMPYSKVNGSLSTNCTGGNSSGGENACLMKYNESNTTADNNSSIIDRCLLY